MLHIEGFSFPALSRCVSHALLAAAFATSFLLGPAAANAAEKPTAAQQETMVQCLIGCNKNDANCQNGCMPSSVTDAYSTCVRACADSTAVPGQQQSQAGDLKICVQACN